MTKPIEIKWISRLDPLPPLAVLAAGPTAARLKEKLLSFDDEKLSSFRGVTAENLLFVTGPGEELPWLDGVIYLGKYEKAPSIFLPSNLRPDIPLDLFEKAMLLRFAGEKPFAVYKDLVIPVGKMRPISRKVLTEIL